MARKSFEQANWRDELALNELVLERSRLARRRRADAELARAVAAIDRALPPNRLTPDELRTAAMAVIRSTTPRSGI